MRQDRMYWLVTVLFVCICVTQTVCADKFEENIFFNYYNSTGELMHVFNLAENNSYPYDDACHPAGRFAIVVFGWKIDCEKYFVRDLITNLTEHRGGCVICMNYNNYSQVSNYLRLRRNFNDIQNVLKRKLIFLEQQGFDPDNGYLFGFSFGANLVLGAAKDFGAKKIREIDVCEIIGMAFDSSYSNSPNHRKAAKNVQCLHTSRQYGTKYLSSCHQDWILGDCGEKQEAAPLSSFGSHGVCPLFYNSAFDHDFLAVENQSNCTADQEAENWPSGFKMGYMETRKSQVRGQLFAPTYGSFPFNVPSETPQGSLRNFDLETEFSDFEKLNDDDYATDLVFDTET
ncbi:uncharacterized protein LOC131688607 [Topomyia yanbarensis]|uniref:uncharacterized protein LOC131688607 n=1 Tax=Topomyia yanbarensis TaxID=2498891 RepID=UPI00273C7A9F|nr:uncharacterized protein LOC131688607 [Topomyia yanbarensis]